MKKYQYSIQIGDNPIEEFEYFLTAKSQETMDWIDELEEKEIMCYFDQVNPEDWDDYSYQEKTVYYKTTPIDIAIKSVFFRNGGDNEAFLKLKHHSYIDRIHIYGGNIELSSFRILKDLKHLQGLLIYGNYSDELVPYLIECKNLDQLDVQSTKISQKGSAKLRNELENTELWLP